MKHWLSMWGDLFSLRFMSGSDRVLSFTKLTVVALYAWVLWHVKPEVSRTFITLLVLLAVIPFGMKGLTLFVLHKTAQPNDDKEEAQ